MRFFNGACFLLAVLLILGYAVARPHIGTVYTLKTSLTNAQTMKSINNQWPYPSTIRADCERRAEAFKNQPDLPQQLVSTAWCVPETRLRWGW
jgi:hypothetical protein